MEAFTKILSRIGNLKTNNIWFMVTILLYGCGAGSTSTATTSGTAEQNELVESADLLERAKQRTARGDTLGAIASYDALILSKPDDISALGNRAILNVALGRDEQALQDYDRLLLVDSENFPALNRRASLLARMGRHADALQDLLYIEGHLKDDPDILNRIGEAYLRMGKYREALFELERALKVHQGWEVALRNRAATYYAMGDFDRSAYDYQSLLSRDPQDSEALNGLGLIFQFADNDPVGAETQYRKALLANPNNAGAWYNIAFLEASQNKTNVAIQDFGTAIRIDKRYADAYVNRGLLYMRVPDAQSALKDFQAALSLQPDNAHNRLLVGWAKCETGSRLEGCLDLAEAKAKSEPGVDQLIATYCK